MTDHLITNLPPLISNFQPAPGAGLGWIPIDFETADAAGTGLAAGAASDAPELVLDLALTGRHVLHFALGAETALRVWLDGDTGYREFVTHHGGYAVQECAWHARDLTGRKLHISMKSGPAHKPSFLAYIRAVPAGEAHESRRNLVATNDGMSWVAYDGIEGERDVWKFFEPLRESDFGLMLWGPGGADYTVCHDTKIGTTARRDVTHAFPYSSRVHATAFDAFLNNGGDILRSAVAAARETGVRIHFYIRPEAFWAPFPNEGTFDTDFIKTHPGFRCRDEFGDEIMRLSYAFPEVQNHMLAYFEEILEYGPDGLCFAFNRSLPMMICEEPVLEEFRRQQGRPAVLPEETDGPEMAAARAALMNGFLARVRALLDRRGLEFSAMVAPDVALNQRFGLDLMHLAESGVLSEIMVHNGGLHAFDQSDAGGDFWQELATKTRVYPNGWGGSYDHAETAKFLKEKIIESGFAGGFFWDTENFTENPYNWFPLRRGGTPAFVDGIIAGEIPSPHIASFTRIRGVKMGRYNPGLSY